MKSIQFLSVLICLLLACPAWAQGSFDSTIDLAALSAQEEEPAVDAAPAEPAADEAEPMPESDSGGGGDAWPGLDSEMFTGVRYQGGRGLITIQGMSGMFLNPTSGTLRQGQLTVQWCVLLNEDVLLPDGSSPGVDLFGNGVMTAYGITDWLEVGNFTLVGVLDPSPFKTSTDPLTGTTGFSGDDETLTATGPFVRVRLLEDKDWMPEVSVGGIYMFGTDKTSDLLARQEVFLAASKHFAIDPDGVVKGVRIHGGVRHLWRHTVPDGLGIPPNGTVGYVGAEVGLPYSLYFVSEVSTKDDVIGPRTPYAFGIQWRPNNVVGISVAGMQPGDAGRISLYVGLGLNFQF